MVHREACFAADVDGATIVELVTGLGKTLFLETAHRQGLLLKRAVLCDSLGVGLLRTVIGRSHLVVDLRVGLRRLLDHVS